MFPKDSIFSDGSPWLSSKSRSCFKDFGNFKSIGTTQYRWKLSCHGLSGDPNCLSCLPNIPRCNFPHDVSIEGTQLHGFSDASENVYSAVTYFRFEDTSGNIHISLITSKMKVAPIKWLTIPRLELCGALSVSWFTISCEGSVLYPSVWHIRLVR